MMNTTSISDNITDITDDSSHVSVIQATEYFYNLLPCYIFIITAIYRFVTIINSPFIREKIRTSNLRDQKPTVETPGAEEEESTIKIIISNPQKDIDQLEEKTASYYIKTRFSFANCFLYIIAIVFAFLMPSSLFRPASSPNESFLYLFGVLAWYFSGKLVKMEFERGLNQEIYSHRLFWVFAGSLSLIRIFQASEVQF